MRSRHAEDAASTPGEEQRIIPDVPRKVQKPRPDDKSLQPVEVTNHEVSDADGRVEIGLSGLGFACTTERTTNSGAWQHGSGPADSIQRLSGQQGGDRVASPISAKWYG